MYYIPNRQFNSEVRNIYNQLFSGITIFKRKNNNNDFTENNKNLNSLMAEDKKQIIKEALAKTLGFKSFHYYKKKTKFLKDIKLLTELSESPFNYINSFEDLLKENLSNGFLLSKDCNMPTIQTNIINNIKTKKELFFINSKYKNIQDFYYCASFVFGQDLLNDFKNNIDIIKNKLFINKSENNQLLCEYPFFEELNYVYEIGKLSKEISNLDKKKKLNLIQITTNNVFLNKAIKLYTENDKDFYGDFLDRFN